MFLHFCAPESDAARPPAGSLRIVSVSSLHDQARLLRSQLDSAVLPADARSFGRVSETVLIAQRLLDLTVDLLDRIVLRHFEERAACFRGQPLHDFPATIAAACENGGPQWPVRSKGLGKQN